MNLYLQVTFSLPSPLSLLKFPNIIIYFTPCKPFVHTYQGDNSPLINKNNSNRQIIFAMQPYRFLRITLLLFHSLELVDHWFEWIPENLSSISVRIILRFNFVISLTYILVFLINHMCSE